MKKLSKKPVVLDYFSLLEDPRISGMVKYPLEELIFTTLCAVLSGANSWEIVAEFGKRNLGYLKKYLLYKSGSPSHDTYCEVFSMIDGEHFSACLSDWASSLGKRSVGEIIAIDGKTVRGSRSKSQRAIHIVSAFATASGLVIGQCKTAEKSNEITAIPELLDTLFLKGCIVTIDAMGLQKAICKKIVKKKADYVISLKGNQGQLLEDVSLWCDEQHKNGYKDVAKPHQTTTLDKDHGRIEERRYTVLHDVEWLKARHDFAGLRAVAIVESTRTIGDKVEKEKRLYISSVEQQRADRIPQAIRSHWAVENTLHWSLDVSFGDDRSTARTKNLAFNLSLFKRIALNMLKKDESKGSLNAKRHRASWDKKFLSQILFVKN